MAKKQPPMPREVVIERDGTRHTGSYTVESGVVQVIYIGGAPHFGGGTKATQAGHASPENVARRLLWELVTEQNRD